MKVIARVRRRSWEGLEVAAPGDSLSRIIDTMILCLVFGNVLAVILESVESIGHPYHDLFVAFEKVSVAAFSAELLCRIGSVAERAAQPKTFGSVPASMWWAICTLTTVGYGDAFPISPLGTMLAAGIQRVGIAMVALPTSLFASGFAHIMERSEHALEEEASETLADGVLTDDEASAYAELAERLHVEPEIAREIIGAAQRKQERVDDPGCPHRGKSLDEERRESASGRQIPTHIPDSAQAGSARSRKT